MKWIHSCYTLMRNVLEAKPVFSSLKQIGQKDAFLAALLLDHLKEKHLDHLLKYYQFDHPEKGDLLIVYLFEWVIFRICEKKPNQKYHYYELQRTCECITEYVLTDDFSPDGNGILVYRGQNCDVSHEISILNRKNAIEGRLKNKEFCTVLKQMFYR